MAVRLTELLDVRLMDNKCNRALKGEAVTMVNGGMSSVTFAHLIDRTIPAINSMAHRSQISAASPAYAAFGTLGSSIGRHKSS